MTSGGQRLTIRRGEVWLVNFDPQIGEEIKKTRPAVVVSRNEVGRPRLFIVVPFTTSGASFQDSFWMVPVQKTPNNGLANNSWADSSQVKSLSSVRFISKLGMLEIQEVQNVVDMIALGIGHNPRTN